MLEGIKVLDCGAWGVGPEACFLLGCLGADVVRIESPGLDGLYYIGTLQKGVGTAYIGSHINSRNIIVDLKTEEGRKIVFRLAEKADVLIENHPPQTMEKRGLGYEAVRKVNPRIIYCSSSGYGREGPLARSSSADPYMQAASGFASINGEPGSKGEMLRFYGHIDMGTAVVVCQGVLLALLAREITGQGQKVETSQFETTLALQATRIAEYFATGGSPKPMGTANPNIVPSQAFKTLDGKYVNVSVPREEYWLKLCRALGLDEIEQDPRFVSNSERVKNREWLIPILEKKFSEQPARWWLISLPRHGVPCGPYKTFDEIIVDPHILANSMIVELDTPWGKTLATPPPLKFTKTDGHVLMKPPPEPDQNRKEILSEIGYKDL